MKNPLKRKKVETTKKETPVKPVEVWGPPSWRGRRREQSYSSAATPDDSNVNVSRADLKGTRSLRGTMIHRSPKTLRGKGVVQDKSDTTQDSGSK